MRRLHMILIGLLWAGAGVGAYLAAASQQPPAPPAGPDHPPAALTQFLELTPQQAQAVAAQDPDFQAEASALKQTLRQEQHALATLLETPGSSDQAILAQAERVIEAHDALERRVTRYVLAMRSQLSPAQQRQLMGLCARGVREWYEGAACRCGNTCRCQITDAGAGGDPAGPTLHGGGRRWRGGRGQ